MKISLSILLPLVLVTLISSGCKDAGPATLDSRASAIIDMPSSISGSTANGRTAISRASVADNVSESVYGMMRDYVGFADDIAWEVKKLIWTLPKSIDITGTFPMASGETVVISDVDLDPAGLDIGFSGENHYDKKIDLSDASGEVMQLILDSTVSDWNRGIVIIKYDLDSSDSGDAGDEYVSVVYDLNPLQAATPNLEIRVADAVGGFDSGVTPWNWKPDRLWMKVWKTGDILDVVGTSLHPNAPEETGDFLIDSDNLDDSPGTDYTDRYYMFRGLVNAAANTAVAEAYGPPNGVPVSDWASLIGADFSVSYDPTSLTWQRTVQMANNSVVVDGTNTMHQILDGLDGYLETLLGVGYAEKNIVEGSWTRAEIEDILGYVVVYLPDNEWLFLLDLVNPVYFNSAGYAGHGTAPGSIYPDPAVLKDDIMPPADVADDGEMLVVFQ